MMGAKPSTDSEKVNKQSDDRKGRVSSATPDEPGLQARMSAPMNALTQIQAGVWVLGFVSLLMDISSEMIHSLLPLFMVTILGTSTMAVGVVEGLAESLALVVKVFSGTLSDYWGKRKGLTVLGYALGAFTKPLFALATGIGFVLIARLLDRVGKGV